MNIQDNEEYCIIPRNVHTRFTFFEGFGFKELLYVSIGVAIGGTIYLLMSIFPIHNAVKIIGSFIFPCSAFILTMRDQRLNKSLLDLILDFYKFKTTQQEYFYIFGSGREKDGK